MEYKALKDIAKITMGQSPDSSSYNEEKEGLPFFQGNADFGELYPNERVWCNDPKKVAEPGDILISVRAPIGALNYAKDKCCIGRGLAAITIEDEAERNYVFHLLKARNKDLNQKGTGSTFKAIGKNVLEEVAVPQISRDEQQKCMDMMDLLESIIRERKSQLDKLDDLIKARFVEMFDDIKDICDAGYYIKSLTAGKSLAGEAECENKVLKTGAASFDYFDASQVKNLPLDYEPQAEHLVKAGDIIISRMNTAELTGAAAYVWDIQENVYLPDRLWKANLNDECNPIFVWQMLIQPATKEQIRRECSGTSGSMKNISKPGMLALKVKKVPFELQNQFADFVQQVDKSKVVALKAA
ncbi:restriction endonuclease subunit S [Lachnobacterium bovis]|uniref:restriction endonuclease subunit S n=1 Tax=Lachnobacterium bovis TaxID=140626 RepID=UPI000422C739|nr:restriction endonuclease subunit S [Lachnobacterium bovis]